MHAASHAIDARGVARGTLTIRITDAAKALSIGRTTIYKLIADGTLQTIKVGRRRLILTQSIRQLCDQPAPSLPTTDITSSTDGRPH